MSNSLPETGTFKIASVGPVKTGNSKKTGKPWRVFSLQFEGDPQWYDTFWTVDGEASVGQELKGTKSFDGEFDSYKFEIERQGGKGNWNPAAANASVMIATAQVISGFLALPGHYELWVEGSEKLKPLFQRYIATLEAASKQIKEKVIGMGSLAPEEKVAEKSTANSGDPGPTPPPDIEGWPEGQEPVDI